MVSKGALGYKIGRKLRLMKVDCEADLLWQILVREIFVLMKHYGTVEKLREAFINLKDAKGKLKPNILEKCKIYNDLNRQNNEINNDWHKILRYCQHSFINILDAGYFLNNGNEDSGMILVLDFNTNSVRLYDKNYKKERNIHETAKIDEIMEFEDMPTKSLTEIIGEMRESFIKYSSNIEKIRIERENVESIINKAKELGGEQNIIQRANKLLDDLDYEKKKQDLSYRVFYNRLDALNLIDYNT